MSKALYVSTVLGAAALCMALSGCKEKETQAIVAPVISLPVAPVSSAPSAPVASDAEAVGVMMNLALTGTASVTDTYVYNFNTATAANHYSNVHTGLIYVTCAGNAPNCDASNRPTTPPVPTPLAAKTVAQALLDQCVFRSGGALGNSAYVQDVPIAGVNGQGSFNFEYSYVVQPITAAVTKLTSWDFDAAASAINHKATIKLNAEMAGLTVQKSSNASIGTRASFELNDQFGESLIRNLAVKVDGTNPIDALSTIQINCAGCKAGALGAVDFAFSANAGLSGSTELLPDGLSNGFDALAVDARAILNGDSTSKNDDGGSSGAALSKATLSEVTLMLLPGDHSVELSGLVKDVGAKASKPITVQQTLVEKTGSCPAAI